MALRLPTYEELFPNDPIVYAPAPTAEPPAAQTRVFDTLPAAEQDDIRRTIAWRAKQQELAANPRGALSEIGAGLFGRGALAGIPSALGTALKATGKEGDTLYDIGAGMVKSAADTEVKYAQDVNPGAHGPVVSNIAKWVESAPPSIAPMVAGLALAPFTGGTSAMVAAGVLGGGVFGAAQYQDTYEKALKAGKTAAEAHALGLQTGAVEGLGDTIGTVVGAKALAGFSKFFPRTTDVPSALKAFRDPKFLPELAKGFSKQATVEVGTEMGQGAAQAAIEQGAGVDPTTPWEAATGAIGPAITTSVLMAPFGGAMLKHRQSRNRDLMKVAEDPEASPEAVAAASGEIAQQIEPVVGKEAAASWRLDLLTQSIKSQDEKAAIKAKNEAEAAQLAEQEAVLKKARELQALDAEQLLAQPPAGAVSFKEFEQRYKAQPDAAQGALALPELNKQQRAVQLKALYVDYLRGVRGAAGAAQTALPPSRVGQQDMFPAELYGAQAGVQPQARLTTLPGPQENMLPSAEAAANAARVYAARDAAEATRRYYEAVQQVVANPPEGMPTFAEYAKRAKQAAKKDPLGGGVTEVGLRQGYLQLANEMRRAQEPQQTQGVTPAEAAQPQLGFEDTLSNPLLRKETPVPEAPRPTAMQLAMKQAQVDAAWRERKAATSPPASTALAAPAPDLVAMWKEQHAEKLPLTPLPAGQWGKKIEQTLQQAAKQATPEQQLQVLREARDQRGEQSASYQSLDALIGRLENRDGPSQPVPEGQDAGQRAAEPGRQEGQEGLLKTELSTFVDPLGSDVTINAEGGAPVERALPTQPQGSLLPSAPIPTVSATGRVVRLLDRTTQRTAVLDAQFEADKAKYDFEHYRYDPAGATKGTNALWVDSYKQALRDLKSFKPEKRARAEAALKELTLTEREGEAVLALGKQRAEHLRRVLALNEAVKGQVEVVRAREAEQARRDVAKAQADARLAANEMARPRNAAERAAARDAAKDDFEHVGDPVYAYDGELEAALAQGGAKGGLEHLAENGPTEWVQDLSRMLLGLDLPLKVGVNTQEAVDEAGGRVYGRYSHADGQVQLYAGGMNAHTFLHEVVHGATIGRLLRAGIAEKMKLSTPEGQLFTAQLQDLRRVLDWLRKNDKAGSATYAYGHEAEFIAEVFANEQFRARLAGMQYDARNVFQKIADWILGLFGKSPWAYRSALEKAMGVSQPFVSDSRFGKEIPGATFDHSSTAAAQVTDATLSRGMAAWERLAAKHDLVADLRPNVRALAMEASSTWNLHKLAARIPALEGFNKGMLRKTLADNEKQVLRGLSQQEAAIVTTPLQLYYAGMDAGKAQAMNDRLARLAAFSSIHNVQLWDTFAANQQRNSSLTFDVRQDFERMRADFKSLPEVPSGAFMRSFKVLRKGYMQYSANTIRELLRAYSTDNEGIVKEGLQSLDIRSATLLNAAANPRPDYYLDAYSASLDKLLRTVLDDLLAKTKGMKTSFRADLLNASKFYHLAVGNPYAHLGRSGEFFVRVRVAPGDAAWERVSKLFDAAGKVAGRPTEDRQLFARFDNEQRRTDLIRLLEAYRGDLKEGLIESGSITNPEEMGKLQGIPQFAAALKRNVGERFSSEEAKVLQEYIDRVALDMMPDSAPQKMLVQRKNGGVGGSDADFMRNFAKRMNAMSSVVATGYTMPKYDTAFKEMKEAVEVLERGRPSDPRTADLAKMLYNETSARFANSMSPLHTPHIDAFRAFGFNMFLAFSPAFWLTNLMQPWHIGLPWLGARYGFVSSAKELGKSSGKAFSLLKGAVANGWDAGSKVGGLRGALLGILDLTLPLEQSGLRPDEQTFLRRLIESGQLDATQGHEIGHIGEGENFTHRTTMKALSAGSHYTEVFNRLAQGLAAYNLSLKNAVESKKGAGFAIERGIESVRETQLDYSDHNVGRALGRHGRLGKITPLLTAFQTYAFQVTELLVRMTLDATRAANPDDRARAWKEIAGVLGTTSVLAGTLGIPFASVISAVIDRVFGSDDDPLDSKSAYHYWLAGVFGKEVADVIARGAPRALGIDTSNRMGLADILPGSRFLADRRMLKDQLESGAFDLLGPAVSASSNVLTGMGKVLDGYVMDGLAEMAPVALKGPLKAAKMADVGYTNTAGNIMPMEVTPWDVGVQTLGFTPTERAKYSEHNFARQQREYLLSQEKRVLSNRAMTRIERGEDVTQELQDVAMFSTRNPEHRIDLAAGLRRRAQERAMAETHASGLLALPRFASSLERYDY